MDVIAAPAALRGRTDAARRDGRTVAFVATMGALHEGHLSLLRRAREERDLVAMSIFVNPLQFGPAEDLAAYPRYLERDLRLAENSGVDVVLAPGERDMYPRGRPEITLDPGPLGERLEGAARPGHFRGVLTVVAKLFHAAGPCRAYFGEKDAQQLALVRRMAADLDFPVEVVGCPTEREPDGLALSSRNVYLDEDERRAATALYRALAYAAHVASHGERDANTLRAEIAKRVAAEPLARLDYVAVVDEVTFEDVARVDRPARALVAARLGKTRLIDNVPLSVATAFGSG